MDSSTIAESCKAFCGHTTYCCPTTIVVTSTFLFIALAVLEGKFGATFNYIGLVQFAFIFFYIPPSILFFILSIFLP